MNTNKTPARMPLTKEQLDVIAASLMTGEARFKDSRMASVARNLEGALCGGPTPRFSVEGGGDAMYDNFCRLQREWHDRPIMGQNPFQDISGRRILLGEM